MKPKLKKAARALTLDDVAKAAGVSKMTASRALRGASECGLATRRKVQAVAARLGYRANPIIALFHRTVHRRGGAYQATLGWVNDYSHAGHHLNTLHLRRILRGAEQQAIVRGFKVEELWFQDSEAIPVERRAQRFAQIARARGMPGVVLPILRYADLASQPWAEVSVACIGGMVPSEQCLPSATAFPERFHHVRPDFFANMELACVSLRQRGYRRIGLFLSEWHNRHTGSQYEAAFRSQMRGWPVADRVPPLITPDLISEQEQKSAFVSWVERKKPDVIISALGQTLTWLKQAGWKVPEDKGLAHIWLSDDTLGWSGVDPLLESLGASVVDQLIAQIQVNEIGKPLLAHRLSFLGNWLDGETTEGVSGLVGKGSAHCVI
jgi:LacI family transcriptional regulator